MKIIVFAPLYGGGYGAGYAAYKETEYLYSKFHHDITVVHSQDDLKNYRIPGVKYLFFKGARGRSKFPVIESYGVYRNINQSLDNLVDKSDVIYNQSPFLGFIKKEKIKDIKVVTFVRSTIRGGRRVSVEDSFINKLLKIFVYYILESLEKRTFKFSNTLIVKSSIMKSELMNLYGVDPEKIYIISGGVDSDFTNTEESKSGTNSKCIAFIGRIEPVKGLLRLIDAVSLLKKDKFILKIAGDYRDQRYFKRILDKISKHGLDSNVSFLGKISQRKVSMLIANSRIVVVPSWYEPFGMVATQAANMKKPIVVSDKVGAIDVLNDYEGIFIAKSTEEFASALNDIIQGNFIIKKKAKFPDWDSVVDKINDVLVR